MWLPLLSHFARDNILGKYYLAYMRLKQMEKRKKHYISERLGFRFAGRMQQSVMVRLEKKEKNAKNSYK